MKRVVAHAGVALAGFLSGAASVVLVLYLFPFAHLGRAERVMPTFGAGKDVEVFTLIGHVGRPGDPVSITHGGQTPLTLQPPGIQLMSEPAIRGGLALITRVRDESGRTVGIATELESGHEDSKLLTGRLMTHTTWTVVVPGRGAAVLYQAEDNWALAKGIVIPAVLSGKPWQGHWRNLNTLGPGPDGHGRIVALTGAYAGRTGSFVETAEMRQFTPRGELDFTMEVRLALDPVAEATPAQSAPYAEPQQGEKVLSFHAKLPAHALALTHSGHVGLGFFPADIPKFTEPGIRTGLIANMKLADERGEVIGFASELELFPEVSIADVDDVRWSTGWALAITGRGMIFLEQIEHSGGLGPKIIQPTRKSGQDWLGDWLITTTVGPLPSGRGRIVGGTGEFADISGSFVEIDRLHRFTPDGGMVLDLELRLFTK